MATSKRKINHFKDFLVISGVALALLIALFIVSQSTHVEPIDQSRAAENFTAFAVLGDSNSDEYRADDNRGGSYAATTFNWVELLVKYRSLNFGSYANWGGFRRTGYQYNFSRSGATTTSALQSDAPAALAALVNSGVIRSVYYQVGANDYAWYNSQFPAIYNGTLSGSALHSYSQTVANNVATTLDIINASGKAKILVSVVPDATKSPTAQANYPDPVKLARVSAAVLESNTAIRAMAAQRGYAIFDADAIAAQLIGGMDAQGNSTIGGEKISFTSPGDEPHHILIGDAIHAGTVFSGVYANEWMKAMNAAFGTQFAIFTDAELLSHAGIRTNNPTPMPTAIATIAPTPVGTPRPTSIPTMTPIPTIRPTVTPVATIMVTPRPTVTPTKAPTPTPRSTIAPTPRPTAIPTPVDPLVKYCGQYRTFRYVALRFLTPTQVHEWDVRCGL